jgi:hypothetical protein
MSERPQNINILDLNVDILKKITDKLNNDDFNGFIRAFIYDINFDRFKLLLPIFEVPQDNTESSTAERKQLAMQDLNIMKNYYNEFMYHQPEDDEQIKEYDRQSEIIARYDKMIALLNGQQAGGRKKSRKTLENCTVAELKEKAEKRKIKVTGLKKHEIIAKLRK